MTNESKEAAVEGEAARVALRDAIERARELICEAKQVIGKDAAEPDEPPQSLPPNAAA